MMKELVAAIVVCIPLTMVTAVSFVDMTEHTKYLRKLTDASKNKYTFVGNGPFIDSTETLYYDFSLAWRFLGFYVDCNVCIEEGGDDDNNGGEQEGNENEKVIPSSECLDRDEDRTICRRHALWAAYVDESYDGDGPMEYQHFDHRTGRWDRSACSREGRCAKLDCHDPSSRFKLVGVFKDPQPDTFVGNLVDYQGDCVWNDEEYKFMQAMNDNNGNDDGVNYHAWPPSGCTSYQVAKKDGTAYSGYYDAIPTSKGNLGIALYTDSSCTEPNKDSRHSVQEVLTQSIGSTGGSLGNDLTSYNQAMDVFKVCQPCIAYDTISNSAAHEFNSRGDRYVDNNEDDAFVCRNNLNNDEPINQCRVLVEEGTDRMTIATYNDILLAESQGTVTGIDLSLASSKNPGKMVLGKTFMYSSHTWLSLLFLLLSVGLFYYALAQLFERHSSKHGQDSMDLDKPLVGARSDIQEKETKKKKKTPRGRKPNLDVDKSDGTFNSTMTGAATIRENKSAEKIQKKKEKRQKKLEKKEDQRLKQAEELRVKELRKTKLNPSKRSFPGKSILKKSKIQEDEDGYSEFSDDSSY